MPSSQWESPNFRKLVFRYLPDLGSRVNLALNKIGREKRIALGRLKCFWAKILDSAAAWDNENLQSFLAFKWGRFAIGVHFWQDKDKFEP